MSPTGAAFQFWGVRDFKDGANHGDEIDFVHFGKATFAVLWICRTLQPAQRMVKANDSRIGAIQSLSSRVSGRF